MYANSAPVPPPRECPVILSAYPRHRAILEDDSEGAGREFNPAVLLLLPLLLLRSPPPRLNLVLLPLSVKSSPPVLPRRARMWPSFSRSSRTHSARPSTPWGFRVMTVMIMESVESFRVDTCPFVSCRGMVRWSVGWLLRGQQ